MKLQLLKDVFCVCRLDDLSGVDLSSNIFFLSKTDCEVSLVCKEDAMPKTCERVDKGWKGMRVVGALDFSLVGILADISSILANAKVPIFAISTYDTDYVLLKQEYLDKAICALKDSGYEIE